MPDPFAAVRPGDPLPRSSAVWNAIVGAAKADLERRHSGGPAPAAVVREASIVRVENTTGGPLDRAAVVGLTAPIFAPAANLDAFLREVAFQVAAPAASSPGKFGVMLGPVPAGAVGRAFVAGVCPVRVNVTDAAHKCAEAVAGDTSALKSSATGSARILSAPGGTGVQWAYVRLAVPCPPASTPVECGAITLLPNPMYFTCAGHTYTVNTAYGSGIGSTHIPGYCAIRVTGAAAYSYESGSVCETFDQVVALRWQCQIVGSRSLITMLYQFSRMPGGALADGYCSTSPHLRTFRDLKPPGTPLPSITPTPTAITSGTPADLVAGPALTATGTFGTSPSPPGPAGPPGPWDGQPWTFSQ